MSAKFMRGPYQCDGRFVFKLVDNPEPKRGRPEQVNLWLASVHPCGEAVESAELEAVATLFQAAPLLYEALEALHAVQNGPQLIRDAIVWQDAMDKTEAALRAARGE